MEHDLLAHDKAESAAEEIDQRSVLAARRDVVDDALVAARILRVECRGEEQPLLVDARLRVNLKHAVELCFALAVVPDRNGQLCVVREDKTVVGDLLASCRTILFLCVCSAFGNPGVPLPERRSDGDVALVPERTPPGDVLGALGLLSVKRPAFAVKHLVRAPQPFRLVLARMIARDRGQEECAGNVAPRHAPLLSRDCRLPSALL